MRFLIINMLVGQGSSGLVFDKLIREISKYHKIDLICANPKAGIEYNSNVTLHHINFPKYIIKRLRKYYIALFHLDPLEIIWNIRVKKYYHQNLRDAKYDFVFGFMSSIHFAPLVASVTISKLAQIKCLIYSVDPLPQPLAWSKNKWIFGATKKYLMKYTSKISAFFAANNQMLGYTIKKLQIPDNIYTDCIYTPCYTSMSNLAPPPATEHIFLYTGVMFGIRNPKYVLEAFKILLTEYFNSKLLFIGTNSSMTLDKYNFLDSQTKSKISILPFKEDLNSYYQQATALIDIDADTENDVYLSSKITNYINVDRIIISETGTNSPSKHLFKNIPSIIQCDHNSQQLYKAMKFAIKNKSSIQFNDRENVRKQFNVKTIYDNLIFSIQSL